MDQTYAGLVNYETVKIFNNSDHMVRFCLNISFSFRGAQTNRFINYNRSNSIGEHILPQTKKSNTKCENVWKSKLKKIAKKPNC